MSVKERQRMLVIERVERGELQCSEASVLLGVTDRHVRRILLRYRSDGASGLVHKGRGRASGRQTAPLFRERVIAAFRANYSDFGPTLASEMLRERDGLSVNPETLRLWLIEANLWQIRHPKRKHRSWRERKACFGELVQMDGSIHSWFEDRGARCFQMSMVDDATGRAELLFAPQESTQAAMDILGQWISKYGLPAALYVDHKNVYVTDRQPTLEEELAGKVPLTQFGRACDQLGIRIIAANSPQAKGRVERKHGVCQDRLLKQMRLDGISSVEQANEYLTQWLPSFNSRFMVAARNPTDLHRALPSNIRLESIFCRHELRTIHNDWTVRYNNRWFQLLGENESKNLLPKTGARITVQLWRDGSVHLVHKGVELAVRELPSRPQKQKPEVASTAKPRAAPRQQPMEHPWKTKRKQIPEPWLVQEYVCDMAREYLPDIKILGSEVPVTEPDYPVGDDAQLLSNAHY